jgi:hypothetical protein
LAGSAAYAGSEALQWPTGLARRPKEAVASYAIALATTAGVLIKFSDQANPSSLLERGDKRRDGVACDGDNNADVCQFKNHGKIYNFRTAQNHWLDRDY